MLIAEAENREKFLLKISFIRMVFSFLALGSLLTNFEYSGWQTMSAAELTVHLLLVFSAIVLGTMSTVGYRTNVTVIAFAWAMVISNLYVFVILQTKYFMHAQMFFAFALMVLNTDDCGRYFTISAVNTKRTENAINTKQYFRAYLIGIYIMSVFGKITMGYLSGVALESQLITYTLGSFPLPITIDPWVYMAMSFGGLVGEILIPIGLLWRRSRFVTVVLAYVFHMILLFFLHPRWFSFGMPVGLLVFIDDSYFAKWIGVQNLLSQFQRDEGRSVQ